MLKMLLRCRSIEDARVIKNYVENELPYEVLLSLDHRDVEYTLKNRSIQLVILQTGVTVEQDLTYVQHLRGIGYQAPVLVLTNSLGRTDVEHNAEKHKIYFLERPFEMRALKGLARKLMVTKVVPRQEYRRYRTNVEAQLETFITGDKYTSQMFNLSMGGAYFELAKKPQVGIGDLLRLKVKMGAEGKMHNMHGRIVWTTAKGMTAGGYGLGVKFLKSSDIYRKLLDKV